MSEQGWSDLPKALGGDDILSKLSESFNSDSQFLAFTTTQAITKPVTFGIKSSGSDSTILVTVEKGKGSAKIGRPDEALFTLSALPEQWEQHFQPVPKMPYQSYWGMLGMNIKQEGVEVLGDQVAFAQNAHIWRRTLELLHDAFCGPIKTDEQPEMDEDYIQGNYVYVTAPVWGKCKLYVEHSGQGKQQILFLHTAGSDGRQYHGVMNDKRMRQACSMFALDLPGHGKSFPSREYHPGAHTNTEEAYVGCIAAVVKKLGLKKPIVCGASMAGQVCLAVAIHCDKVGAGGVIPMQACDHLNMERSFHDLSPLVNQALWNPEWVYGMMSPTAPAANKALIWHLYSSQAYGIFHGDLDFYFGGWDGRDRMGSINTRKCPVFMLTGEYDWSNTPEMAQKTADKIPGARHKSMEGLGHFPATENPGRFVPFLLEAVEWILAERKQHSDVTLLRMIDE
ncbi:hypothetical protein H2201_009168 [Coniosporium apollinis]|uniref:AB hydrolase-1 domain-containing protein n=2 Tax=Coniosporium TaxID=2810619 RepID=A0ABQ9NF74_9PEZI|nr:hypothetical protein H2199_004972 [Cladosporium sp. JES 115]KAJ9653203.1 hypothetical protein H2201_009168 [Coniosporium apollinis]